MAHQPDLDGVVGDREIGMMPRHLGQVPNRVDHHERAFPPMRLVFAAEMPIAELPVRKPGL